MSDTKMKLNRIWGALLFAAGIGMFLTIPERVLEFESQGRSFFAMKPALYLVSVLLIAGGGRKLIIKKGNKTRKDNSKNL